MYWHYVIRSSSPGSRPSLSRRALRSVLSHLRQPETWVLLAILALAAVARLWQLGNTGFRGDEAVYAGQAAVIAGDDELKRYFILASRSDSNFLLYQNIVSFFYTVFGVSDVLARAVSAVFSILTVLVTFELGRTLYGKKAGLLAALFVALSGYSVALGRLALLDSTMTLCMTLAMLCAAKWVKSADSRWLYAFAVATALAVQTKVPGGLVLPAFAIYLVVTRQYRDLTVRTVLVCAGVFMVALTPALLHVASNPGQFLAFLVQGGGRVSHVPWYYYISKVTDHEGYLIPVIWMVGVLFALRNRTPGDVLALAWVSVVIAFFQLYPLKAFNYMLPIVPVLSVLAARAIISLRYESPLRAARIGGLVAPVAVLVAFAAVLGTSLISLNGVLANNSYSGLREASYWLQSNTSQDEGVITMSRGSAQYVMSFYAQRDSYPFGRFRLATVIPGGVVVKPRPAEKGAPVDWVSFWPHKLIQSGEISYLVYYTEVGGDDPPEEPIARTANQRQFRKLIEAYDGRLIHTVYRNHEPRVWIYEVTKRLPRPELSVVTEEGEMTVRGEGFVIDSRVTIYYHSSPLSVVRTDDMGSFQISLPLPERIRPKYYLSAEDGAGNYDSLVSYRIWQELATAPQANPRSGWALLEPSEALTFP